MSNTIRETSPLITPDSLRKINQMNQAFYETYTKKNFGRTDVYGSQYSGTVENFGSEMLLETRKLRMEKPSLEGVFEINNYKYYFDIQYSNMIETYEQQGMLEAVLKKDVFLPDKEYTIKFVNCEDVYIPRSEGWGQQHVDVSDPKNESKVYKDRFIHTKTAPKLLIKDLSSGVTTELDLKLEVAVDYDSDYYFYNGFATEKFIASYAGGTLVTTPIRNEDSELPFVWICVDIFKSLPPIDLVGVSPIPNKPLLVIGTDGQNESHMYPLIYGIGSLPDNPITGKWYLKAFSELDGFIPDGSNNYSSTISKIYYTFRSSEGVDMDYQIGFDQEYIKISLSDKVKWSFVRDTMNDPYHAEIPFEMFHNNGSSHNDTVLIQAFDVGFSDNYLFYPYEGFCEEAMSGIHVDIMCDYSNNSVIKKNGVIHSLGDFDGLPSYFKKFHDNITHRSHVELYTIRDRLNRYTQKPMEKQTAALLIDSAMPQKELKDISLSQPPAIIYQYDPNEYRYVTDSSKVVSKKNVVSEITFINENNFGNCNIPSQSKKKKFIYHGNRTFSLSSVDFDPELETARVYYINNDSISYVNNAMVDDDHKKAPRTLARICDIPTEYERLLHITNQAATYIFDDKYVRMTAGFTHDDIEILMNDRRCKVVQVPGEQGDQWLYYYEAYLPSKQDLIDAGYVVTKNISNSNIPITLDNFKVIAGGTGYSNGDKFYVLVGGIAYDGVVTDVDILGGYVISVNITVPSGSTASVYNLDGAHTVLKTVTTQTETGTGLKIELEISQADYDEHFPEIDYATPPENLISFAFDGYGNIFLYELQSDWTWKRICQVEGEEFILNPYDRDPAYREFKEAFYKWIFQNPHRVNDTVFFNPMEYIDEITITDYEPARGHKGDDETADLSQYIVNINMPNTYYELIMTDSADNGHFDLSVYEMKPVDDYEVTLPRFHRNNTVNYFNPTNRLLISDSENLNNRQPSMFVYSPTRDKRIDETPEKEPKDVVIINSEHTTTYNDYGTDIMDPSGKVANNIYYYPEYEFSRDRAKFEENIRNMQRSEIITYIRDHFGSQAEPLLMEDTDYKYNYDSLVAYILDRYPLDAPEYIKDNLKVHAYAGSQTINSATGESLLDNPPTGGMVPLTAELFQATVTANGKKEKSLPMHIFIIEDVRFGGFNDDFKVFDEDDNDITSQSIIIWRGDKYVFNPNDLHWYKLAKRVKDAYYNISDRMFYYDEQYSQLITPDSDIIYRDITTGQYYKWNGVSYVLITI